MQSVLSAQLVALLRGGNAHMNFDEVVADFPMERINDIPPHGLYSSWHLIEHIRLTQRDILDFITDPQYKEPTWPDDYWPDRDAVTDASGWTRTITSFQADLAALIALVEDPATDFAATVPWGNGQTMLREFLLVADHNSYHIGELGSLRQTMQTWPADRDAG